MDMMDRRMLGGLTRAEVQELRRLLGLVQRNLEELSMELGEPVWEEGGGMPPESMGRNLKPEQDADPQLEEKKE